MFRRYQPRTVMHRELVRNPMEKLHQGWVLRIDSVQGRTIGKRDYEVEVWPQGESWRPRTVGVFDTPAEALAGGRAFIEDQATMGRRVRAGARERGGLLGRMFGGGRRNNPSAQRELIDDLTGAMLKPSVDGAQQSGRLYVRVRPDKGEPFEMVPVDYETLDPDRDKLGIDPKMAYVYKGDAEQAARLRKKQETKLKRKKPMTRSAQLTSRQLGFSHKMPSTKKALAEFMGTNEWLDHANLDAFDLTDEITEIVGETEVERGRIDTGRTYAGAPIRKMVSLKSTPQGKRILGSEYERHGSSTGMVQRYVQWLLSQGNGDWRRVPWGQIENLHAIILEAAEGQGWGLGPVVYPPGSGMYSVDELVAMGTLSEKNRKRANMWLASQRLYDLVDSYEAVLKPKTKAGRQTLRCIPAAHRKIVRERLKVLRKWAKYPELVPEYACYRDPGLMRTKALMEKDPDTTVSSEDFPCTFQRFDEDIERLQNACDVSYDPYWTWQARIEGLKQIAEESGRDYATENDQVFLGFAPISVELPVSVPVQVADDIDEPWDRDPFDDIDEPWERDEPPPEEPERPLGQVVTAANPKKRIKKPKQGFVDAQRMAKKHPGTFEVPTDERLKALKPGDFVKVNAKPGERFWVKLDTVKGATLTGVIDNELVYTDKHGLKMGDRVKFQRRNAYDVLTEDQTKRGLLGSLFANPCPACGRATNPAGSGCGCGKRTKSNGNDYAKLKRRLMR